MTEDEIHRHIANLLPGDRTLEAFTGWLEITATAETEAALSPKDNPLHMAHDCGRAASIRDFLSDVRNAREDRPPYI